MEKKESDGLEQIIRLSKLCLYEHTNTAKIDEYSKDLASAIRTYIAGCLPPIDTDADDMYISGQKAYLTAVKSSLGVDV